MKVYIKSSKYILHGGLDSRGYWNPLSDTDYDSVKEAKAALEQLLKETYYADFCYPDFYYHAHGEWIIEECDEYGDPTDKVVARGKLPQPK